MSTAREYCDQAQTLISAGRHDDARRVLARAESLSPRGEVRADVVAASAWVMGETGDLAGALARCRAELTDHDRGITDLTAIGRAIVLGRVAALEVRAGNDDAALPLFDAAEVDLIDRPAARGRVLINRAYLRLRRRDLVDAAADLDEAQGAFAAIGDTVEQAKVLHNRGYVDLLTGDLAGSLDRMNDARIVLRDLSPVHRAVCDLDRAEVLEAAGMVGDAVDTLEQVLLTLDGTTDWHTRAESELLLARLVATSDGPRAIALADTAAQHFRDNGSEVSALRADAIGARVRLLHGAPDSPDPDLLAQRLIDAHLDAQAVDLGLHAALHALREFGPDAAEQRSAAITVHPDAPVPTRLLAAQLRSSIDRTRGAPRSALDHCAAVMDDFIEWQTHFGSLSLQVATQRRAGEVVLQGMNAAWETGDPEQVLTWSERARGAAAAWNPVRAPRDPAAVSALAELRSLRDSGDTVSHHRRAALQEQVRDLGWRGSSSSATRRAPTTVADAAAALTVADADLVTFLWLRDRLVAMTLSDSRIGLHDLGEWSTFEHELAGLPADLDLAAGRLGPQLRASVAQSLTRRLERLDALLVAPVIGALRRTRIVLTVPGVLGGVPWALLPSLSGRSPSVAVSVGWWIGSTGSPAARPGTAAVVCGPGTEHGEREANAVAAVWAPASSCIAGGDATTTRASELASSATVLHVCAHGGHSREHPLFSSVGLADGPWFGHDIELLSSVPSLVVISACDMGRAVGEYDTLGMARAWLHAGARCVVAAPCNVDDERAANLFPRVHHRIAAGTVPGDALIPEFVDGALGVPVLCYGNAW